MGTPGVLDPYYFHFDLTIRTVHVIYFQANFLPTILRQFSVHLYIIDCDFMSSNIDVCNLLSN